MSIAVILEAIKYLWEAVQIVDAVKAIASYFKKTPTPPKE